MDGYADASNSFWDLSQIPDEEFLALLQKQLPSSMLAHNPYHTASQPLVHPSHSINPQNVNGFQSESLTSPSEDGSTSPSLQNMDHISPEGSAGDSALKRKVTSDDDLSDDGPSHKTQHIMSAQNKKAGGARRKSIGGTAPAKDESRLLKRKEQNRAAQRAFRERKERHVKDLEDKVAELEAKNEVAAAENENLRDLLQRLQSENVVLKQSPFTFSAPKASGNISVGISPSGNFRLLDGTPNSQPSSSKNVSSPASERSGPRIANPLDWSSLTSFDPAMLNLLDDQPQSTATNTASMMDFGFSTTPYTTIANNPAFISYASTFDSATPPVHDPSTFNFDMGSISSWPSPPVTNPENASLDDIFAPYFGQPQPMVFNGAQSDLSPVAHHQTPSNAASHSPGSVSSIYSSSSPGSSGSEATLNTPVDHPSDVHDPNKCPKNRSEIERFIEDSGPSPFAPPPQVTLKKTSDSVHGSMINCRGSLFPSTTQSDENIEVLAAWRKIVSNPKFKDADINELCSEFTNKARCDGTKVVLEPQGVNHILDKISSRQ